MKKVWKIVTGTAASSIILTFFYFYGQRLLFGLLIWIFGERFKSFGLGYEIEMILAIPAALILSYIMIDASWPFEVRAKKGIIALSVYFVCWYGTHYVMKHYFVPWNAQKTEEMVINNCQLQWFGPDGQPLFWYAKDPSGLIHVKSFEDTLWTGEKFKPITPEIVMELCQQVEIKKAKEAAEQKVLEAARQKQAAEQAEQRRRKQEEQNTLRQKVSELETENAKLSEENKELREQPKPQAASPKPRKNSADLPPPTHIIGSYPADSPVEQSPLPKSPPVSENQKVTPDIITCRYGCQLVSGQGRCYNEGTETLLYCALQPDGSHTWRTSTSPLPTKVIKRVPYFDQDPPFQCAQDEYSRISTIFVYDRYFEARCCLDPGSGIHNCQILCLKSDYIYSPSNPRECCVDPNDRDKELCLPSPIDSNDRNQQQPSSRSQNVSQRNRKNTVHNNCVGGSFPWPERGPTCCQYPGGSGYCP